MTRLDARFSPSSFDCPANQDPDAVGNWRRSVPVLVGDRVTLRELALGDAESLHALLAQQEVARFVAQAPTTLDGFERFIEWMQLKRRQGGYVCFAVVPHASSVAVGLFQIRVLDGSFQTAEWGFALAPAFWGSGIFRDSAELVLRFAFDNLGVHRLEARAAVQNGRGNAALRKMGAVQDAVLRRALHRDGQYLDQILWSILDTEWRVARSVRRSDVHVH